MTDAEAPLALDERFFTALIAGDLSTLDALLADDFVIVDVMSGTPAPKSALLEGMREGVLTFSGIDRDPAAAGVRVYGDTAIVINQTVLRGSFAGTPFETRSRYTHVFVRIAGKWRMVSAQGTPIG